MLPVTRGALLAVSACLGCAKIAGLESGELAPATGGVAGKANVGGTSGVSTGGSAGSPGSAYAAAVLSDGPIGYWRFGEATTPYAEDASGNGNRGIYQNVSVDKPGALAGDPDTCVYFDGTFGGKIDFGDKFGFAPDAWFSVEFWYKPEKTLSGLVGKATYESGYHGWMIVENNEDKLNFIHGTDTAVGATPALQTWMHLVGTFDGVTLALYSNGQSVDMTPATGSVESTTATFEIGDPADWGQFQGFIDELAIYDKPLSAARVQAHYDIGIGK